MKDYNITLEEGTERACICKYVDTNKDCILRTGKKCTALSNCMFFDKYGNRKQCPFYQVDRSYKYAIWDRLKQQVYSFEKNLNDARASVKVASGDYYASGLDDKRFIIKDWKGYLWKLQD